MICYCCFFFSLTKEWKCLQTIYNTTHLSSICNTHTKRMLAIEICCNSMNVEWTIYKWIENEKWVCALLAVDQFNANEYYTRNSYTPNDSSFKYYIWYVKHPSIPYTPWKSDIFFPLQKTHTNCSSHTKFHQFVFFAWKNILRKFRAIILIDETWKM